MSNIGTIIKQVGQFIAKLAGWAKTSISHGREIANEIKGIVDNPAWDIAVSFTSTGLDDAALKALRAWLQSLVVDMMLVQGFDNNGDLGAASTTINNMDLPEAKAGILNAISAAAATKVAELKGNTLPIETALTAAQSAYFHKELLA